jgi:hypothetical protein
MEQLVESQSGGIDDLGTPARAAVPVRLKAS